MGRVTLVGGSPAMAVSRFTLPDGYLELEYIQSTGTQYVDTRFAPNQDSKLEIMFQTAQTSSGGIAVCDTAWQSNGFGIWCNAAGYGNDTTLDVAFTGSEPIVAVLNKNKLYKDGNLVWTATESTFQTTHPLTLMALRINGAMNEYLTGKLFYCKLWDNDTLIRDYIPCVSPFGEVGLFDRVGWRFYGNSGTGAFSMGSAVEYRLPDGYKQLAYIQSSGTQFIDTGFKPNQNTRVVMDAQSTVAGTYAYFGGRNASQSKSMTFFMISANSKTVRYDYGATEVTITAPGLTDRVVIDADKNRFSYGGVTGTHNTSVFQSDYSMYLLAVHNGSATSYPISAKLYSCRIFDNGVCVRWYVPAMSPTGSVGMYDLVTQAFFGNAGTGVFIGSEVA